MADREAFASSSEIVRRKSEEIVLRPLTAPKLLTFDAEGTLIQLTAPRGLQYREALLRAHKYYVRLPGPQAFEDAFAAAYAAAERTSPCYGCGRGVSSHQWWYNVMQQMYARVCEEFNLPIEVLTEVQDELFDDLFYEVFAGPEAWELTRHCGVVLERLRAWRDSGEGPVLGVLSNADERLVTILDNLGILDYFDFVVTSREIGCEKPSRQMFDVALTRAGITVPREALHCGNDLMLDVLAAKDAGWQACHIQQPPFEEDRDDVSLVSVSVPRFSPFSLVFRLICLFTCRCGTFGLLFLFAEFSLSRANLASTLLDTANISWGLPVFAY
ncbi:unnamed protein product [Phaeothamnion confervicola]